MSNLRFGYYLIIEKLLRWSINPRLRSKVLSFTGASIGNNVRIYEINLFNLNEGFSNLHIKDDVHIGTGCRLDLKGTLKIGKGSTLSPSVLILTHADPGSAHNSILAQKYPPHSYGVEIGENCWIGANVTILDGIKIADCTIVAAGAVVNKNFPENSILAGVPAKIISMHK
ncbi:acyltransferase [Denitrificimonas caeni]|uniref:acyltransferase n=1 Tax=Denitrificimonas caeni TaxID=521720 RepID=UPI0003B40BAB|nr:acyltransferase [Denitrificimonas caeni]